LGWESWEFQLAPLSLLSPDWAELLWRSVYWRWANNTNALFQHICIYWRVIAYFLCLLLYALTLLMFFAASSKDRIWNETRMAEPYGERKQKKRKIVQLLDDSGAVVQSFNSGQDAAISLGIPPSQVVIIIIWEGYNETSAHYTMCPSLSYACIILAFDPIKCTIVQRLSP